MLYAKRGQPGNALAEVADARQLLKQSPEVSKAAEGRFALARLLNCIGTLGTRFGSDNRSRTNRLPFGRFIPQGEPLLPDQIARIKREAEFNTEALTLLKELTTESPDNVSYQVVLGRSLRDEARIARMLKEMPRADAAMRRSIELFEILCKAHPDSAAFKYELADTLSKTGDQQRCTRAFKICEEISKENPQVPEYRALKATTLIKLAMIAGRTVKGEELLIEAIAIQRELSNRYADVGVYNVILFQSLKRLSELQDALGQPDKARESLRESSELAERARARLKTNNKTQRPFMPFVENLRDRQQTEKRNKESKE